MDLIAVAQHRDQWRVLVDTNEPSVFITFFVILE
jgi:hypothetical protein